jgi:hypothetical protein
MNLDSGVPTSKEIWEFLVGLKDTTEAGFNRVSSELIRVETSLRSDISRVEARVTRVETLVARVETRVARIENWNLDLRFDALEQRVARL